MEVVVEDNIDGVRRRLLSFDIPISKSIGGITRTWKVVWKNEVNIVIANMLSCYRRDITLNYSRSTSAIKRSKYNKRGVDKRKIMLAVDWMTSEGYLINNIVPRQVVSDKMVCSSISPTVKFILQFCSDDNALVEAETAYFKSHQSIVLRQGKTLVDYKDSPTIVDARRVVDALNALNRQHVFVTKDGDIIENIYARVFSRGCFSLGGRWFRAGVLQIPNKATKDRLRVMIDGESCTEIDFSAMHISMLADIFNIPLDTLDGDLYYLPLTPEQYSRSNRQLVKECVNIMLNCTKQSTATKAIQQFMNKSAKGTYCFDGAKAAVAAVRKGLWQFDAAFCSPECYGLSLQNKDSWINHYIVEEFVAKGFPALPIHDSVLVKRQHAQLLIDTMAAAYKRVMCVDRKIRMKMSWVEGDKVFEQDVSK